MKRTNILKTGVIVFGSVLLSSCGDGFLDTRPKTSLLDENYYKTVADAEMALIGCYDGWQRTTSNGNPAFYVVSEVLSDDCYGATGNTDNKVYQAWDRFDRNQDPSQNDMFNGTWSDYYAAIFRCNMLLSKLDGIDFKGDTGKRACIEGETRFLRAILYFDLVRLFENIPLLEVPSNENIPQADPADVYKLIAGDLVFAADNIPREAYPRTNGASNDGRVTRWAAKSILARVYLFYTGYYGANDLGVTQTQVLQGLEDVISSGEFDLEPVFHSMWQAASYIPNAEYDPNDPASIPLDKSAYIPTGTSKEAVFTQKFNSTQDYNGHNDGNRWQVMMGLRNTPWSPYGQGWGACTVSPKLVRLFEAGDVRKVASIIDIEGEGIPMRTVNPKGFDIRDQREYTGYTTKKYSPTARPDGKSDTGGDNNFQHSPDTDFVVMRYADVLLMAAELGSPNAQSYLDRVRARAGLASKPVSKENILAERRLELAFEGIRYWDLLRQGVNTAASTIAETLTVKSGGNDETLTIDAANITATRGFMQIPSTQITLSKGVLKQNAGW